MRPEIPFLLLAAVVSFLVAAVWGADVAADRRCQLSVVEPTPLLSVSLLNRNSILHFT
jgi:hypothetical protein